MRDTNLVNSLREHAERARTNEWETLITLCDDLAGAADLIEARAKEIDALRNELCLKREEIVNYLKGTGYGWHISDLRIYDAPRELSEFTGLRNTRFGAAPYDIKRPPQSWCYVEEG